MRDCHALLISEKRLFRDGLKEVLEKCCVSVIGEAYDVSSVMTATRDQADPELVIYHVAADQNLEVGLNLVRSVRQHFPRSKIVLLADAGAMPFLPEFVSADVSAVLLTDISSEML